MSTNRDLIRLHLEQYIYEMNHEGHCFPNWFEALSYCAGYYGEVTVEMIMVVRELQREGKIK